MCFEEGTVAAIEDVDIGKVKTRVELGVDGSVTLTDELCPVKMLA